MRVRFDDEGGARVGCASWRVMRRWLVSDEVGGSRWQGVDEDSCRSAGGDVCQPPCGAFWFLGQWHQKMISKMCIFCPTMHYWGSTHIFVLIMLSFDSVLKQKRTWVCMILQNPGIFTNWETGSVAFMRWEVDGLPTSVRCSGISSSRGTLLWSSMVLFWKHSKIGTIL